MSYRKEVFEKLVFRAAPLFGKASEELTEATRFVEDCGAKSVQYSQITTYLEDEFDIEIPYMEFRRQETFGDAVKYVVTECLEEPWEEDDMPEGAAASAPASMPAQDAAPSQVSASAQDSAPSPVSASAQDSAPSSVSAPAQDTASAVPAAEGSSAKSDHDDELALRERFTLKETFHGEELEAVYMVARKPTSVDRKSTRLNSSH